MSVPISNLCERNVFTDAPSIINVPAATPILALLNEQRNPNGGSLVQRLIQNVGTGRVYYSENLANDANRPPTPICDNTYNYHGYIEVGQQLDCSSHTQCVSVYSPAGSVIAVTIRRKPQY